MEILKRLKSPIVIIQLLTILGTAIVVLVPGYDQAVKEIIGAIAVNTLGGSDSNENSQESDHASADEIRDIEYSRRQALTQRLHHLDDALERIAAGDYGLCAECGARIVEKRLASDPAVLFCVGCQAATESRISPLTL